MTADAHCCTSRCCSDDACCSTTLHMQQHMHCAGGHDHAFSARGVAQQAVGSSVGAAGQQQQNMMTSSSSGPVTTRMHAAAICCKYIWGTCAMTTAETVSPLSPLGQTVRSSGTHTVADGPPALWVKRHPCLLASSRQYSMLVCCCCCAGPMESRLIHNILDRVPGVLSVDVMVVTLSLIHI